MPEPGPSEDRPSVLDQIRSHLPGNDEGTPTRTQDDDCDECGAAEGSMIYLPDWPGGGSKTLCRSCYNDPDVWPDDE